MPTPTMTSVLKVISERRAAIASICCQCQFSCLRVDATTTPANLNSRSPGYGADALTNELLNISILRTCMTRKLRHRCQTIMPSERRSINKKKFRASFDSLLSSNILNKFVWSGIINKYCWLSFVLIQLYLHVTWNNLLSWSTRKYPLENRW